jgi:hypothetical protein
MLATQSQPKSRRPRYRYRTYLFEGLLQPAHVAVGGVPRVSGRHKSGCKVAEQSAVCKPHIGRESWEINNA